MYYFTQRRYIKYKYSYGTHSLEIIFSTKIKIKNHSLKFFHFSNIASFPFSILNYFFRKIDSLFRHAYASFGYSRTPSSNFLFHLLFSFFIVCYIQLPHIIIHILTFMSFFKKYIYNIFLVIKRGHNPKLAQEGGTKRMHN